MIRLASYEDVASSYVPTSYLTTLLCCILTLFYDFDWITDIVVYDTVT